MRGRPTCSCDRPYRTHIAPLLRCTDPRGATSCGSRKPRGEQIAKPAERGTRLAGPFFPRESWDGTARAGHTKRFARRSSCCDSSRPMTSRRLMTLQVVVPPPQRLGAVPHGTRVIAPITSGTFEGPRLRGRVLPGGGDWTLLRSDAVLELDLRITLETDDGALISMTSFGLRHGPPEVLAALARGESVDPSPYYFRTPPRIQTSAPQHEFLNRFIAIASCDRRATGPIYTIEEIL